MEFLDLYIPVVSDQRGAFLSSCTTLPVLILLYDSGLVLFCSWLSIQCKCCTVVNHAVISFAIENHLLHRYYFFQHLPYGILWHECIMCHLLIFVSIAIWHFMMHHMPSLNFHMNRHFCAICCVIVSASLLYVTIFVYVNFHIFQTLSRTLCVIVVLISKKCHDKTNAIL